MTNTDNNSTIKAQKSTAEITTIDQLAESLAEQTRFISDNIMAGIRSKSREYKPIISG
jgi:hypothetical protein